MTTYNPRIAAQRRFRKPDYCLTLWEILERYANDPFDANRELMPLLAPERPDDRVCELGFGLGWLLEELSRAHPRLRLYGLDLSPGMVEHVRDLPDARAEVLVGDMERLPFRDEAFDTIVTCWTLYFMTDIDGALVEIKRCLRPGGRFVAATVAPDHLLEYDEMDEESTREVVGVGRRDPTLNFNLESGESYVRRHFERVSLREWRSHMTLPALDPLMRMWDIWHQEFDDDDEKRRLRARFEGLARARLERDGELRLRRHGGAFVGFKEG